MKAEGIVERVDEGKWVLTDLGQQSIETYLRSNLTDTNPRKDWLDHARGS